jgi:hypothetical protein
MKDTEYMGGEVERHVIGKSEEQPARIHAELPPKPVVTKHADQIQRDIQRRMAEIKPLLSEYDRLVRADKALSAIK